MNTCAAIAVVEFFAGDQQVGVGGDFTAAVVEIIDRQGHGFGGTEQTSLAVVEGVGGQLEHTGGDQLAFLVIQGFDLNGGIGLAGDFACWLSRVSAVSSNSPSAMTVPCWLFSVLSVVSSSRSWLLIKPSLLSRLALWLSRDAAEITPLRLFRACAMRRVRP